MDKYYQQLKEVLLPILRCTTCNGSKLTLQNDLMELALALPLHQESIRCVDCHTCYPLTEDSIPIMWSPSLKNYLMGEFSSDNLAANIEIYNKTSDDYQYFVRQGTGITTRIQNAIKKVISYGSAQIFYHLDLGCGPGHILGDLKNQHLRQIGLDVSLVNLRNARKNTGALVVCGDASCLPFADHTLDLITESSVLHHIQDWQAVLREACRVCQDTGGIIIDSEPTKECMSWSPLAVALYQLRFPIYKILSYVKPEFYIFRDTKQAKLNQLAEIHHQPNTGFPLDELRNIFVQAGFEVEIILSPSPELQSRANLSRQLMILHLLSGHNPWNPKYGTFTAIAKPQKAARSN